MRAPDWRVLALGLFGMALLAARLAPRETSAAVPLPSEPVTRPALPAMELGAQLLEPQSLGQKPVSLPRPPPVHPLAHLSDDVLEDLAKTELSSLGSLSIGRPERGALINAVRLSDNQGWHVVDPDKSYGTQETVAILEGLVERLGLGRASEPRLFIGDISSQQGGHLRPHRSHQSGRDVDLGYFYSSKAKWYTRVTDRNLDRPRTWALVSELIDADLVEYIFIDRYVQSLLIEYARSQGVPDRYLDSIFQNGKRRKPTVVRHANGHRTHLHVRFKSPVARESARRLYPELVRRRLIPNRSYYRPGSKDAATEYFVGPPPKAVRARASLARRRASKG